MALPQRVGGRRILKELSRDPLGSTYRATGADGAGTIDDLVLLRTFEGLDAEALEEEARKREAIWPRLPHVPFLGLARERGLDAGAFYLLYDYEVELSFDRLLDSATEPLTPELAVLIADRVAQALAPMIHEGALHGFAVPPLVHLSNEGEVRLLGAEVGPALLAGAADRFPAAIAPELRQGTAPTETGQVYSLGVLLFAALTGSMPAPDAGQDLDATLGAARLADDGSPLPHPLVEILHRSLAPADQRIQRIEIWQQALKQTAAVTGFQANPFELAMYMHRRLERRLEREPEEIAEERMAAGAVIEGPDESAVPEPETPPAPPASARVAAPVAADPPSRPLRAPWIAAVLGGLLLIGGAGWLLLGRGDDTGSDDPNRAAEPAAAVTEPAGSRPDDAPDPGAETGEADASTTLSAEELESQIDALVARRERELSAEHARRLADLESQLEETRRSAETSGGTPATLPEPRTPAAARDTEPAAKPPAEPPAEPAVRDDVGAPKPEARPSAPAGSTAQAPEGTEPPVNAEPVAPPARQPESPAVSTSAAEPTPSQPIPSTSAPTPAATRRGDLVLPGPGVRPPKLQQFPEPEYPPAARRRGAEGTVVLKVLVDENGRVADVEVIRGVVPDVGLDAAAVRAAERARFAPATKDGVAVKTFYTLTIPFSLSAPRQ